MKPPDGSASTPNAKKKSSAKAQSMNHTALCKQVQIPGCVPTSLSQDHKTLPLFLSLDDLSSCFNLPIHVFFFDSLNAITKSNPDFQRT